MELLSSFAVHVLGVGAEELSLKHILARCALLYVYGIVLVRIGNKRFVGKLTAFDIIIAIIIGSLLSRAITEERVFLEIVAATMLLILLHRFFSFVAAFSDTFGNWIKGHDRVIVQDGEILWSALRKSNLSEQDLMQNVRLNARVDDVSKVKTARLERNGDISIILKDEGQ